MALDESEKKQVVLKREAESKAVQCQDLLKQLANMKEKHEIAVKKVIRPYFLSITRRLILTFSN